MSRPFLWLVKITGAPVAALCFRTRVHYARGAAHTRRIRGGAVLVCNHTSVYDYAVLLFVFFTRTLRVLMAEVLFRKRLLGWFLRRMGGIRLDRTCHDFAFLSEAEAALQHGEVEGVFPEGRLPKEGEQTPLPFQPGAVQLALQNGVPILPVYTNGRYFGRHRARVIIGAPMDVCALADPALPPAENVRKLTELVREEILRLERELHEQTEMRQKRL